MAAAVASPSAAARAFARYPIGTPGQKWGDAELQDWRSKQTKQRDYFNDVVSTLHRTAVGEVFTYGELDYRKYGFARYPLYAVKSAQWVPERPMVLVTGGVHGYETSGVHGALLFIQQHLEKYSQHVNVLVLPCLCPWGYEVIHRWTPLAVDPNRGFDPKHPSCQEAAQAMACIVRHIGESKTILMHMDLHETTDSDNDIFRPAKCARDGEELPPWSEIPDGFYVIGDTPRPQLDWQKAMIDGVSKVTHIAEPDENGMIAGEDTVRGHGILICDSVGDCASFTDVAYTTTTEVYPDSKRTNPEECNRAQAAVIAASLDFIIAAEKL